jgi:hypothetical protein
MQDFPSKGGIQEEKEEEEEEETLFTCKIGVKFKKNIVKCCVWILAVYGAETRTLLEVDQKYMESFEVWCWRRSVGLIV